MGDRRPVAPQLPPRNALEGYLRGVADRNERAAVAAEEERNRGGQPPPRPMARPVAPHDLHADAASRAKSNYNEQRQAGLAMLDQADADIRAATTGDRSRVPMAAANTVGGVYQYLGSPAIAAIDTAFGDPLEVLTGGALPHTLPGEVAQFMTPVGVGIGKLRGTRTPRPPVPEALPVYDRRYRGPLPLRRAQGAPSFPPLISPLAREAARRAGMIERPPPARSAAAILRANKVAGDAWESVGFNHILPSGQSNIRPQITVKSNGPSGRKVRLDAIGEDMQSNALKLTEMKASKTADLTPNQRVVFPELHKHGGVIVGKGKDPHSGGKQIPPTRVEILRKPET